MKKRGFTLVELLAVIVIIGIVSLIIFPSVTSYIEKSKKSSYNIQKDLIEKAAKKWVTDNSEELLQKDPYHLNNINLTITTLKKEGYLENNYIVNPQTKKVMTGCVVATYQSNQNQYEFQYNDGKDTYSKNASSNEKLKEEIAGCDNNKGYIYTYYIIDGELEKTNGILTSTNKSIELSEIFADYLIKKSSNEDTGLINLGNQYFYQGLTPTNYVKIDGYDTVWNILSINNNDKTIKLVAPAKTINSTLIASNPFNASSYASSSDLKPTLEAEINKITSDIIKNESEFSAGIISDVSNDYNILASEENQTIFTGKIGIITASEYLKTKSSSGNSYLDTQSGTAWTMNFTNGKHVIINTDGTITTANVDTTSRFVYPTILINANVILKSGDGSTTQPYVIERIENKTT